MPRTADWLDNFLSKAAVSHTHTGQLVTPYPLWGEGGECVCLRPWALGGSGEICWNAAGVTITLNGRRDILK